MSIPSASLSTSKAVISETAFSSAFWDSFHAGSRRACARLISTVENDPGSIPSIRDRIASKLGKAVHIGITGPPGVGKSTLSAMIALGLAELNHRVGIIAVDPSSPFTGGAFMGDRVRMDQLVGNPNVYMRSMASREGHGGLSPTTPYVADVIEAFGMDRILIETVGVGQAELDVLACADIVVLVLQPSTGDAIQALKAGIIEGANLVVVNKADLPGAESMIQSLRFVFSLGAPRIDRPSPLLLATSAQQTEGIVALVEEIERQATSLVESGAHQAMRQARIEREIRAAMQQQLWQNIDGLAKVESCIGQMAAQLAQSGGSPYPFIRQLCSQIELKYLGEAEQRGECERRD